MLPVSRLILNTSRTVATRGFSTSARRMADAAPLPAKKPVGAFRGGLFGFLLGSTLAGGAVYSYVLTEYKTANDLLTEDIYTLQASVTRLSNYVQNVEQSLPDKKK